MSDIEPEADSRSFLEIALTTEDPGDQLSLSDLVGPQKNHDETIAVAYASLADTYHIAYVEHDESAMADIRKTAAFIGGTGPLPAKEAVSMLKEDYKCLERYTEFRNSVIQIPQAIEQVISTHSPNMGYTLTPTDRDSLRNAARTLQTAVERFDEGLNMWPIWHDMHTAAESVTKAKDDIDVLSVKIQLVAQR